MVTQVMNLTDVDDKTIRGARQLGIPLSEYTARYKQAFFEDLDTLNIERAEHYPSATEHIPAMIELIRKLLVKGVAYLSNDGSVYFNISKFPEYGKLSHHDISGLKPGARVAQDEYSKENVGDFALWKAWTEEDGDVGWDSPWGRGRPGWHIECSAMSCEYLGETFDIHTGGVDNIFPHHENEIAQSESATGKPFVKYWVHCAHLIVDGRKMSKSLGNFYTLRDILKRGYSGRELRYVLLSAKYRETLNFTFDALDSARNALKRIDEFKARLEDLSRHAPALLPRECIVPTWASLAKDRFKMALDNDLSISDALSALYDLIRDGHKAMDQGELTSVQASGILEILNDFDRVLGFINMQPARPEEIPPELQELVKQREEARKSKDWEKADNIRRKLMEYGWEIRDTPEGPKLKRIT
jgi:cysteinyl-tRNA synthetase